MRLRIVLSCDRSFHTNACQWYLNQKSGEYFARIYLCPEYRNGDNLPIINNGEPLLNPILMYSYKTVLEWDTNHSSYRQLSPLVDFIKAGKVPPELIPAVMNKVKHLAIPQELPYQLDTESWCKDIFGHTSVCLKVNIPANQFHLAARRFSGGIMELEFEGDVSLLSLKQEQSLVGGKLLYRGLIQEIYIPFKSIIFKGESITHLDQPSYDPSLKSFVDSCKSGKKCPVMKSTLDTMMKAKACGNQEVYLDCYKKLEALYLSGKSPYVNQHWDIWKA